MDSYINFDNDVDNVRVAKFSIGILKLSSFVNLRMKASRSWNLVYQNFSYVVFIYFILFLLLTVEASWNTHI